MKSESEQTKTAEEEEEDSQFDEDIDWSDVENSIKQIKKCPGHSVTFPIGKYLAFFRTITTTMTDHTFPSISANTPHQMVWLKTLSNLHFVVYSVY